MFFGKAIVAIAALAHQTAAFSSSTLEVVLAPASGAAAEFTATITNNGATALNLLRVGTILDDKLPVERLTVVDADGVEVPFRGIDPSIRFDALQPRHFQELQPGASVSANISAGTVHAFDRSGVYSFTAEGLLPVAAAGSTTLSGPAVAFRSNTVTAAVDAAQVAPLAVAAAAQKRSNVQAGCSADQLAVVTAALGRCQSMAQAAAADAADATSDRFVEYFRTNSSAARDTAVARLTKVAAECATTDSGASRLFCYDYGSLCELDGPLIAYAKWDSNWVVMCDLFWALPSEPPACGRQSQSGTVLHETTHCEGVFSPHTNDYAYGYNASTALTPERALLNADTYDLYASAVVLGC